MKRHTLLCGMLAASALVAGPAAAAVVDPDYRPNGTATSEGEEIHALYASLGVTFQTFVAGFGLYNYAWALTPYNGPGYPGRASTGTKVFASYPTQISEAWESDVAWGGGGVSPGDRLYVNFTSPVSYVSLDFMPLIPGATYTNVNGTRALHEGLLYVYSGSTLLETIVVSNADPIERAGVVGSNITRVVATARGWPSLFFPPGKVFLDNLMFFGGGAGGSIDLGGGALDTVGDYTLAANESLTGNGTVTGNLTNAGTLDPGTSPGKIAINGSLTQTSTGTIHIDIGGVNSSLIDFLDINGGLLLDGNLHVSLADGFLPLDGQVFRIVDYATRSGMFAHTSGLGFAGGHFEMAYGASGLDLIARLDAPPPEPPTPGVPEPASLALVAIGLAGAALARRRPA